MKTATMNRVEPAVGMAMNFMTLHNALSPGLPPEPSDCVRNLAFSRKVSGLVLGSWIEMGIK